MNKALLTDDLKERIRSLANKHAPQEMCAILWEGTDGVPQLLDVMNTHPNPIEYFRIDARAIAAMNAQNKNILAIVHSHPKGSSDASAIDIAQMNLHAKTYIIVGMDGDIAIHEPERVPLVGRDYVHGTQDCYGIVRDYYARELGIIIPDYERTDRWWESTESPSLYLDHFKDFGFVEVPKSEMRRHDVLLCRWGNTKHVNHALIYLAADGELRSENAPACIGGRLCLHHPYNNKSGRIILGESRLSTCEVVVRHRSLV